MKHLVLSRKVKHIPASILIFIYPPRPSIAHASCSPPQNITVTKHFQMRNISTVTCLCPHFPCHPIQFLYKKLIMLLIHMYKTFLLPDILKHQISPCKSAPILNINLVHQGHQLLFLCIKTSCSIYCR